VRLSGHGRDRLVEILVHEKDLAAAKELLAADPES
jgi:hypothetical protein